MEKQWNFFTPDELKPQGWLKRQLELQANGLSGNLDKVWRDVKDSAWIGGSAEGWERVPYWLDGFIPLAYLLENQDMIARAKKYVDAILSAQREDGWICPCPEEKIPSYDTWAVQLISKTLTVYYECSKDERVPSALYKLMKNYYDLLSSGKIKLFYWGEYRWFESFIALGFLYERYAEEWIKDLAKILKAQGTDYNKLLPQWKTPLRERPLSTHIVNIAMMLKYEAVSHFLLGEDYTDRAEYFYTVLKCYNGTAVGSFTGDEHLNGLSPIQGTELCSVVEQMYSYELLFLHSGDRKWLERLETLAFNALPAAISDDMWTHQYDQMSNQIACKKFAAHPIFGTNGADAHIFGLEPNFGCCTANFSQGWPKFALSAFAYKDDVIFNTLPLPTRLKTKDLCIVVQTEYPFENEWIYTIEAKKAFTFKIRIPSFAKNVKIDGERSALREELTFAVGAGENRKLRITFDAKVELVDRPHDLKSVQYGPLVFALPIKYEKIMHEYETNGVERKFPYCDYEYVGKSDWNYGYGDVAFRVEKKSVGDIPFSSEAPPLVIKAKMKKIPWGYERGYETVCAKIPQSRTAIGEEEEKELYPYGCAKLRMTEIPLVE